MARTSERKYERYLEWKKMGLKRCASQELADKFGVSRQALHGWIQKPITINGVTYANWDEAYFAETRTIRENIDKEINEKLENGYVLSQMWAEQVYRRMYEEIQNPNYRLTEMDKKLATTIMSNAAKESASNENSADEVDKVNVQIGFRSDSVEESKDN